MTPSGAGFILLALPREQVKEIQRESGFENLCNLGKLITVFQSSGRNCNNQTTVEIEAGSLAEKGREEVVHCTDSILPPS